MNIRNEVKKDPISIVKIKLNQSLKKKKKNKFIILNQENTGIILRQISL